MLSLARSISTRLLRLTPPCLPARNSVNLTRHLTHQSSRRPSLLQPLAFKHHVQRRHFIPVRPSYARFGKEQSMTTGTKVVIVLSAFGVVYYVMHLEQVPETGRWRFIDVSPYYEAKIARASHAELVRSLSPHALPPEHVLTRHVHRVVSRILAANGLGALRDSEEDVGVPPESGGRQWNLMVVNDPKTVNAMAAFGDIVVFTGILPVCKDEEGLAAVLGHEIGHSVARHSSERLSLAKFVFALSWAIVAITGFEYGISDMVTNLLVSLPNSRTAELEADAIGLKLVAKACYDPRETLLMQGRLARAMSQRAGANMRLDILQTHPASERRIAHLNELLPEAYAVRAGSGECGEDARAFAGVALGGWGGKGRSRKEDDGWHGGQPTAGVEGEILQDKW